MKRIILFCISLVAWFSLPGLLQADSFRHRVRQGEDPCGRTDLTGQ